MSRYVPIVTVDEITARSPKEHIKLCVSEPVPRSIRRRSRRVARPNTNKHIEDSYISEESDATDDFCDHFEDKAYDPKIKLIRIAGNFRTRWDLLTMLLALYNCLTVPFFVAFYKEQDLLFFTVNTAIDFVFIIDIVLNFFTTYIDRNGDEISGYKCVMQEYLKIHFWVDLVASVPIDNFYVLLRGATKNSDFIQLSDLLKLLRILRLGRIIRFTKARDEAKTTMKLLQLSLYLVVWVHLTGCMWFLAVSTTEDWIPVQNLGSDYEIFESDVWTQYFTSFYHAVWLLTGGEVAPRTPFQAAISSIFIIIGALITAVMFGEMAVLMTNLNRRETEFQEILDGALVTMHNMKLPEELTNRVLGYITSTQSVHSQQEEYKTFQKHISPSLQQNVTACIYSHILKMNYILQSENKFATDLVKKLKNVFKKPEDEIIVQGQTANHIYFLVDGECEVLVLDAQNAKVPVCYLYRGAHFGEIGVVYNTTRTATVRAMCYCTIAELSKCDYEVLTDAYPQIVSKFRHCTEVYKDPWKLHLLRTLKQIDYFSSLDEQVFNEIVYLMRIKNFERGDYLFRPGDIAKELYIITEGEFELSLTVNERHLDYMKERAKLTDIEGSPTLQKRGGQVYSYPNMYLLDIFTLDGLKDQPEIVPIITDSGKLGSIRLEEELPSSSQRTANYPQEIVLDHLYSGTLLHPYFCLIKRPHLLQCKVLKYSTVYSLSMDTILRLCRENPPFKDSVTHYREILLPLYEAMTIDLLDYYHEDCRVYRYLWKKTIIKALLSERENRKQGVSRFSNMVVRLQAFKACQDAGSLDLANRVMRGEIPPHFIMENGHLDPIIYTEEPSDQLPRTHPVIRTFRLIFESASLSGTGIMAHYNRIEDSFHLQKKKSRHFGTRMSNMKNNLILFAESMSRQHNVGGKTPEDVRREMEELLSPREDK